MWSSVSVYMECHYDDRREVLGGDIMEELKEKVTTVKFTKLQYARIVLLARERQWSISKMIQNIIDEYCKKIFEDNSIEYRR